MKNFDHLPDDALITTRYLLAPTGPVPYSKPTLWRRVKEGKFPRPRKLDGTRINVWRLGEVRQWLGSHTGASA